MMETRSVVGPIVGNFYGLTPVKRAWDRIIALFTFLVGFVSLLAPGEN
jgi:hypothetical protein